MATLVHYAYTMPLPGLVDWSAFLEPASFADPVNSQLRQRDPWRALHGGRYMEGMGLKITPVIRRRPLPHSSMFGPMVGTSGTHV